MEQYFTKNPGSKKEIYKFDWNIGPEKFYFYTSNSVFSKNGMDFGSMLLVETVIKENKEFAGNLLDLGCGYGPIGIALAKFFNKSKVTMTDVNERALELCAMNVKENKVEGRAKVINSSLFENIEGSFDMIVTNPPVRAGKNIVFSFYEGAYEHLKQYGKFYVVIQKKQGAVSSRKKINDIFGNCKIIGKKSSYFIFESKK
jgi:16S rRNA (guanine1207-N2)-methyltransferase